MCGLRGESAFCLAETVLRGSGHVDLAERPRGEVRETLREGGEHARKTRSSSVALEAAADVGAVHRRKWRERWRVKRGQHCEDGRLGGRRQGGGSAVRRIASCRVQQRANGGRCVRRLEVNSDCVGRDGEVAWLTEQRLEHDVRVYEVHGVQIGILAPARNHIRRVDPRVCRRRCVLAAAALLDVQVRSHATHQSGANKNCAQRWMIEVAA
mmetsp:Transcript_11326/g.26177  ORF Transcript_11326/g.26177 Transcript_11326/m.26177 type:complete len:211 (+) Transcript_11326:692-1324(+)